MRGREVLLAGAIGAVVGIVAVVSGYGNNSPKGVAVNFLFGFWYVGFVLVIGAWLLGRRTPGTPLSRWLGVVGGAWVGFVAAPLILILLLQPSGV
jgi:hypothetical protein